MSLLDIRDDPNYVNANAATKQAIFDQYSAEDDDYKSANEATKAAIRADFGLSSANTGVSNFAGQPNTPAQPGPTNFAGSAPTPLGEAVAPQLASMAKGAIAPAMDMNAAKGVTANIKDAAKVGTILAENMHPGTIPEFMKAPVSNTAKLATAYVAGHPWTAAAGRMGAGLAEGLMAPESLMMMPYQMAAHEQEKIRANPNAPEYANNPYAMSYRSQGTAQPITQGQAGAINQRNVVANMPYGNVTPEERAILDKDKQDRLKMKMQYEAAQRVLGQ